MAGQEGSDGKWRKRRGASANEWHDSWLTGREGWLEQVPLEAGVPEGAELLRQVKCLWCDVFVNSRLPTIRRHEDSGEHQRQEQQRQQRQQGVAKFQQQLQMMGDQAARKRAERMQDQGLRTQFTLGVVQTSWWEAPGQQPELQEGVEHPVLAALGHIRLAFCTPRAVFDSSDSSSSTMESAPLDYDDLVEHLGMYMGEMQLYPF